MAEFDYIPTESTMTVKEKKDKKRGMYVRETIEPFADLNTIGYNEDPYERK